MASCERLHGRFHCVYQTALSTGRWRLARGTSHINHATPLYTGLVSQIRQASKKTGSSAKDKGKGKKRKGNTGYRNQPLDAMPQFSLCDAMRYIRAFEVGRPPSRIKYDLAVRLKTVKNGPAIRNTLRLPHVIDSSTRICVICPPDSKFARDAKAAGAALVGEDSVFETIKAGKIDFDRCLCHPASLSKFTAANLGRVLGPRGLMPSEKLGTVTREVGEKVRQLLGGEEYREKLGVIRCAIGQLGFSPDQVAQNVAAFMAAIRKDIKALSDKITKETHEVVLSSTNSPGFTLNGTFKSDDSVEKEILVGS